MRFLPTTLLFPILFVLVSSSGCKESCDGVECAPAPPLLTVIVRDTISRLDSILQFDTATGDSIFRDTILKFVEPTVEALLTLHTVSTGITGPAFDTIRTSLDSIFSYDDRSRLPSGEFALVAVRGTRADTLEQLSLKSVEGCCGYEVIGSYSMRLPEK